MDVTSTTVTNPSKISVAERAVWLRDMAASNRMKQQTLQPPAVSTSRHRTSIQDRVRMFESMRTIPVAATATRPKPVLVVATSEHPLQQVNVIEPTGPPPPPQNDTSPSSSNSSLNVVEIISSGDTNTSATTSLSSSSSYDPTLPKYGIPVLSKPCTASYPLTSSNVMAAPTEPEPLLGLPVTSVVKPMSRKAFDEDLQHSKSKEQDLTRALRETTTVTFQEQKWSSQVDEPPMAQYVKNQLGSDNQKIVDDDDSDEDGHILKIIKVVNRSPLPLQQRPLLSLPWDESDDFSDPWMSGTSVLDLHIHDSTDGAPTLPQPLHRLPTTILNPTSLRNHRSQFTTNPTKNTHHSRAVVFVDDNSIEGNDDEEEDDIQTVDNSTIFNFNHDASAVPSNVQSPFTTALSFESTFSKIFPAAPISPILPPPISRYSTRDNGGTNDISVVLKMNWVNAPDKVDAALSNTEKADDAGNVDKKEGLLRRIKSNKTKNSMMELRKRTTSLLCSSKQNHPLMPDKDVVLRSRTTTDDSNNDTTGLWFMKTFDNHDDDMANALPSSYFPPSPLDITSFHRTTLSNDSLSMADKIESLEIPLPSKSSSNKYGRRSTFPAQIQDSNHHESDHMRICSFPIAASAILGNVFAEEIAADAAAVSLVNPTLYNATTASPKSDNTGSSSSLKSALMSHTSSTATSLSTVPSNSGSSKSSRLSADVPRSTSTSNIATYHQPPKSDRISSTIAQLCQTNKNAKFQKKSLIQTRKEQLASNLDRNRSSARNRISKGSWQKDSNGNFKRHFILVDDHRHTSAL